MEQNAHNVPPASQEDHTTPAPTAPEPATQTDAPEAAGTPVQTAGPTESAPSTPPGPTGSGKPGGEDFGQMFEESMRSVQPGEIVPGRVVNVGPEFVTVDIGYKSEGHIPLAEFRRRDGQLTVSEGDEVDVYFDSADSDQESIVLSRAKAEQFGIWREIETAFNTETPIEGEIVGKVKGGLRVNIGVPAFLPGSHVDIRPARDLNRFIGTTGKFVILKYNQARSNVVVSRRAVLEKERRQLREETLKVLEEGVILEGTVKNITDYGAFVDLGGIDGLLHITDMSWGRIGHPSEVIKSGETIKVVVLKFDVEKERVSLGLKQLVDDPWTTVAERYVSGSRVQGKIVSLADYGAFVELEHGVEGLLHVSEMSWTKRVSHPSKLVSVGDRVEVAVLDLDPGNRRISLGLKQVAPNPWETVRALHPIGSRIHGTVKSITDFGVFVEVEDGIDGLAHISDLHWTKKIKHPGDLFKKGDEVDAVILGIDVENERISLGIKQSSADPWVTLQQEHPVGSRIHGTVTSVTDFGVFVEVGDGIEGLIHISQLSTERVEKPAVLFDVGQKVEAEVIHIDPREHKMGLSVKALRRSEEREEMQTYMHDENQETRFSFEDILGEELRLDRDDDGEQPKS